MRFIPFAFRLAAWGLLSPWSAHAAPTSVASWTAVPQIWSRPDRFIIAPNHRWLASVSNNGHIIQIVDNASGAILRTLVAGERAADQWGLVPPEAVITDDSSILIVRFGDITQAWNADKGEVLAKPPANIVFGFRPARPEHGAADDVAASGAYKIAVTMDHEGTETIFVTSGSKHIDPVQLRVSDAIKQCGNGGVAHAIFDGEELVFGHIGGNSLPGDDDLPAVAYRLEHGGFRELWRAPCENGSVVSEFSPDGAFLMQAAFLTEPMNVWSLAANRIVARFAASYGAFAVSADGQTMAASTFVDAMEYTMEYTKTFTVLHRDTRLVFPRPAEFTSLALSPNGRWLAASTTESTSVWSLPKGVLRASKPVEAAGITNEGVVLERKRWTNEDEYHGHRIIDGSKDGRWLVADDGIIFDSNAGKIAAELHWLKHVTDAGRALTKDGDGSLRTLDLATGRTLSTLLQAPDGNGYIVSFADGCVQVSPGAEKFVRLVRGFETRAFDAAARKVFTRPGCRGVAAVIAANEKAFAVERARVAAIAKADVDEQARLKLKADEEARQEQAAQKAWVAGAPAREKELLQAASMVSQATITPYTSQASNAPFVGKVAWHLSKGKNDADAVAVVTVPDVSFKAILAIDKAPASEPDGTGVIAIGFDLNREPAEQRSPSVTQIGSLGKDLSPPSHIGLNLGGPSYLPYLPRLIPASGGIELVGLQPSTWLDIPLVLSDGKTATLSVEIGTVGRRVIDEVLDFKKRHP